MKKVNARKFRNEFGMNSERFRNEFGMNFHIYNYYNEIHRSQIRRNIH
jgi:hypothetical protein